MRCYSFSVVAVAIASACCVGIVGLVGVVGLGVGCGGGAVTCASDSDCASDAHCEAAKCRPATCYDGTRDGDETASDCGGGCIGCIDGKPCRSGHDCKAQVCVKAICTSSCSDKLQNGDETDVDCGGPSCPPCGATKACLARTDCDSKVCKQGRCTQATCSDTGKVDPRCGDRQGTICTDTKATLECDRGYSTYEHACVDACVEQLPRAELYAAFCALEAQVNPACPPQGAEMACDGNDVVACRSGYVTARRTCDGASPLCVAETASGFHRAYCATDGACSGADQTRCDPHGTLVGCVAGHAVAMRCPDGSGCTEFDTIDGKSKSSECVSR